MYTKQQAGYFVSYLVSR